MAELKSKYITKDDFKMYFGIDLDIELKDDDNPSNKVNAFLLRIEHGIARYLDANFYRKVDFEYPHFSDYQKEHYKIALLEQAYYELKNGDISRDSGYDVETGVKATREQLKAVKISDNTREELILCGIWCRKIRNRARSSLDGWWMY